MKWHNLMILLASLALFAVAFADELEIPEDIDEDELGEWTVDFLWLQPKIRFHILRLDEDEEILRMLEQKRIVRFDQRHGNCYANWQSEFEFQMDDLKRENEHARELASKYHAEHGLAEGTESVRMICKFRLSKALKIY